MRVSLCAHHAPPARCMDALCDACCVVRCCVMRVVCCVLPVTCGAMCCCLLQCRARCMLTLNLPAPHRTARPQRPLGVRRCDATQPPPPARRWAGGQSGRRSASAWLGLAARGRTGGTLARPRGTRRALRARQKRNHWRGAGPLQPNRAARRTRSALQLWRADWTARRTLARGRLYVCIRARMAAARRRGGVRLRMSR